MTQKDDYTKWAEYYDRIYNKKNYKKESKLLDKLIAKYKKSPGRKMLDAACGTGNHIIYLKDKYDITGLDMSEPMLKIARKKYKDIKFVNGDMRDFELSEKYDVILCMFSAISHIENYNELNKVLQNFERHLNKGGVFIIEPFIEKKEVLKNKIWSIMYEDNDVTIVRMNNDVMKGMRLHMNFHFLIGKDNKIHYFTEPIALTMFDRDKFQSIISKNNCKAVYYKTKFRGYHIGIKK